MRFRLPELPAPKLVSKLRGYSLLPAIVFIPTRRRCDEAALELAGDRNQLTDSSKQLKREELFEEMAESLPEIRKHKHRKMLLRAGVASHHAGHIPSWKLVIEKMMSAGLLDAIFATSTVAAGVDFPARTVVISNSETRSNDGWRPLQASELQQMTGRAGRRGKDKVGFVVLAPGNFQNPPRIATLLKSPPDALQSQFRATYTTLLNLLDAFKSFTQVREIAERSFAFRDTARQIERIESNLKKQRDVLIREIEKAGFDISVDGIIAFASLASERDSLLRRLPDTRAQIKREWLREVLAPGRIITKGRNNKKLFIVLSAFGDGLSVMREDGQGLQISIDQVGKIFAKQYKITESIFDDAYVEIEAGRNPQLEEPRTNIQSEMKDAELEAINADMAALLEKSENPVVLESFMWEAMEAASEIKALMSDITSLKKGIWNPFERRAEVLSHFGYIEASSEEVTQKGKWLADLRVDRPLLLGEAIDSGLFDGLSEKYAVAIVASLAADPDRNFGETELEDEMIAVLRKFDDVTYRVAEVEWKHGVEPAPEINFSAAAAAEAWASGMSWDRLVAMTRAEEGDLVRLLSRTGEVLNQIGNIVSSNPAVGGMARRAADLVLREPIR